MKIFFKNIFYEQKAILFFIFLTRVVKNNCKYINIILQNFIKYSMKFIKNIMNIKHMGIFKSI